MTKNLRTLAIALARRGRVLTLALNRPDTRNAVDADPHRYRWRPSR